MQYLRLCVLVWMNCGSKALPHSRSERLHLIIVIYVVEYWCYRMGWFSSHYNNVPYGSEKV